VGALELVTAVGCVLVGGVFFAFSTFVLPALARLPSEQGTAAMRSINVFALRPPLMVALFGTALACLVLGVATLVGDGPVTVVLGCILYVVGVVVVTVAGNVPLNNRLEAGEMTFADYVPAWARWNHLRSVAALGAAVLVLLT
jgi:uncharacterized membrane protein